MATQTASLVLLMTVFLSVASSTLRNEAICPPARFIQCGPPAAGICMSDGGNCCWVEDSNGHNNAWHALPTPIGIGLLSSDNFGASAGVPVLETTFNVITRELTALRCNYYATKVCGGEGEDMPVLTLASRYPARYQLPPVMATLAIQETTPTAMEYFCDCSQKDGLPLPERYRCCYWKGVAESDILRGFECRIPRADPVFEPGADCTRTTRAVAKCGDAAGCYCRFEYSELASSLTREEWDCGRCCPALTGDFGRDLTQRHNNTNTNCLTTAFPLAVSTTNGCEGIEKSVITPDTPSSGACKMTAGWAILIAWVVARIECTAGIE